MAILHVQNQGGPLHGPRSLQKTKKWESAKISENRRKSQRGNVISFFGPKSYFSTSPSENIEKLKNWNMQNEGAYFLKPKSAQSAFGKYAKKRNSLNFTNAGKMPTAPWNSLIFVEKVEKRAQNHRKSPKYTSIRSEWLFCMFKTKGVRFTDREASKKPKNENRRKSQRIGENLKGGTWFRFLALNHIFQP
jgi:hypothetical protein